MVTNAVADAGANPAKVVAVQRAAVEQKRDHYDVVVLDTAPLLATNDPIDVVRVADTVVLVVRAEQTRTEALRQAVQSIEHHKVRRRPRREQQRRRGVERPPVGRWVTPGPTRQPRRHRQVDRASPPIQERRLPDRRQRRGRSSSMTGWAQNSFSSAGTTSEAHAATALGAEAASVPQMNGAGAAGPGGSGWKSATVSTAATSPTSYGMS